MDPKIFVGLFTNYLKLPRIQRDIKEAKRILDYMVMDDFAQSFQYKHATFGMPKYCFSSVFYAMYFFKENKNFKIDFYDKIQGKLLVLFYRYLIFKICLNIIIKELQTMIFKNYNI